jgi:flavin-dependent dehydrogenase
MQGTLSSGSTPCKALVAGAGPAGCTAALHLANRGFAVTVVEKRGPPDASTTAKTHQYPMVLSRCGAPTN